MKGMTFKEQVNISYVSILGLSYHFKEYFKKYKSQEFHVYANLT